MSRVRIAVLELTSALHNWRKDPRPENMRRVVECSSVVSGYALDFEQILEAYDPEGQAPDDARRPCRA